MRKRKEKINELKREENKKRVRVEAQKEGKTRRINGRLETSVIVKDRKHHTLLCYIGFMIHLRKIRTKRELILTIR